LKSGINHFAWNVGSHHETVHHHSLPKYGISFFIISTNSSTSVSFPHSAGIVSAFSQ
jgi:hypothetical protein